MRSYGSAISRIVRVRVCSDRAEHAAPAGDRRAGVHGLGDGEREPDRRLPELLVAERGDDRAAPPAVALDASRDGPRRRACRDDLPRAVERAAEADVALAA